MKNKLRKIEVDSVSFLWTVRVEKTDCDQLCLRIWIEGQKGEPWICVYYKYHNPWLYVGDIIAAKTSEQIERVDSFFQFEPLTPKKVRQIIDLAMAFLYDKYADKLHNINARFNFTENELMLIEKETDNSPKSKSL